MPAVASGSQLQTALENVQTTIDGGDDYVRFGYFPPAINAYRTAGSQLSALPAGVVPASVKAILVELDAAHGNTEAAANSARALAVQALAAVVAQVNASIPGSPPATTPASPAPPASGGVGAFIAVAALIALAVGGVAIARKGRR